MRRSAFFALICYTTLPSEAFAAGDAAIGQQLYQTKCSSCHSIDYNGVGPAHKGLFGRKAGSLPDYTYSPAVQASGIVWNEKTIDKWLTNPEKLVPGQKMGFMVASPRERADLIAYLKQATK
ncbi:MAG TPA: c-type cytochrome [Burkholderiaceae bacterium]|jgi:cytochrome c